MFWMHEVKMDLIRIYTYLDGCLDMFSVWIFVFDNYMLVFVIRSLHDLLILDDAA